ncbi:hypothetical protein TSAR_012288 [Trichomalopsis sarcophagae]|uniref:Uncharacterized protein n=1 Tax=Trichomalopsis sarcophagae TaxID=543379 RepID=A0A232FNR5_9HYME|nr:hypothetical protein TSAR_012288 [Trichomalopsis sarcophagae]
MTLRSVMAASRMRIVGVAVLVSRNSLLSQFLLNTLSSAVYPEPYGFGVKKCRNSLLSQFLLNTLSSAVYPEPYGFGVKKCRMIGVESKVILTNHSQEKILPRFLPEIISDLSGFSSKFYSGNLLDLKNLGSFQKQLILAETTVTIRNVKKLIYMTDGAKQQFKNRFQIANLNNHKEDFQVDTE